MATITTNHTTLTGAQVEPFLTENGVIFEQWDTTKLPAHLQENFALTDQQKGEILAVFDEEIASISKRRNYITADVISLSSTTPNLEELLVNFQKEHHHSDDEVRFIVSGHSVFVIQGVDGEFFSVHLSPGDLISVPPNVRHYFTLAEDKQTVAIRLFASNDGWVAIY